MAIEITEEYLQKIMAENPNLRFNTPKRKKFLEVFDNFGNGEDHRITVHTPKDEDLTASSDDLSHLPSVFDILNEHEDKIIEDPVTENNDDNEKSLVDRFGRFLTFVFSSVARILCCKFSSKESEMSSVSDKFSSQTE